MENNTLQIKKELQQITDMLLLNGTLTECPRLVDGKMGIAISFFHYVRYMEKALFEEYVWDLIVAIQKQIHANYRLDYGVNPDQIVVIPNGMNDKAEKGVNQNLLRKKWQLCSEERMILFVGRLDGIKGVRCLIRAFQSVLQKNPNNRLRIEFHSPLQVWSKKKRSREKITYFCDYGYLSEYIGLSV